MCFQLSIIYFLVTSTCVSQVRPMPLGDKDLELTLETFWGIYLLALGLVIAFAIGLYILLHTNARRSTTGASRISVNASHRTLRYSASKSSGNDFRGKNTNSVYVPYHRQANFKEKCEAFCCCKKLVVDPSLSTIPSLDISDEEFELVVEKFFVFHVPLTMTALPEDVADRHLSSVTMKKKETEILMPPQVNKKVSYSTEPSSYYAAVPSQPYVQPMKSQGSHEYAQSLTSTEVKSEDLLSLYYAMVPSQITTDEKRSIPLETSADAQWTRQDDQSLLNYKMVPTQPQSSLSDNQTSLYYGMVPSPHTPNDLLTGSRELNEETQPLKSQRVRNETVSYLAMVPRDIQAQSRRFSSHTTKSGSPPKNTSPYPVMQGRQKCPNAKPTNEGTKVPPKPRYRCPHGNVPTNSHFDTVPNIPETNQNIHGQYNSTKPVNTVTQSYLASVGPQRPKYTFNEESDNLRYVKEISMKSPRSTPYVDDGASDFIYGSNEEISPNDPSIYFDEINNSLKSKERSMEGGKQSRKIKREVQPVPTNLKKTYEFIPNFGLPRKTSTPDLESGQLFIDTEKVTDISTDKGSNVKNKSKSLNSDSNSPSESQQRQYKENAQFKQMLRNDSNVIDTSLTQTKDAEMDDTSMKRLSKRRNAFGAKDNTTAVMQMRSTTNLNPSPEVPLFAMSGGRLVPADDEEQRQLNQYLNQFSSIFTYNLKDPIPKDPDTISQTASSINRAQVRETRTSLAESISEIASFTDNQSGYYSYKQPAQVSSGSKGKRVSERGSKGGLLSKKTKRDKQGFNTYSAPNVDVSNPMLSKSQERPTTAHCPSRVSFKDSNESVEVVTGSIDYGEKDDFDELKKSHSFIAETHSDEMLSIDYATNTPAESGNESRIQIKRSISKNRRTNLDQNPVRVSGMSEEISRGHFDSTGKKQRNITRPIQQSEMSEEILCTNFDALSSKQRYTPVRQSEMSQEIGCSGLYGYQSFSSDKQKSEPLLLTPVPYGFSRELNCANISKLARKGDQNTVKKSDQSDKVFSCGLHYNEWAHTQDPDQIPPDVEWRPTSRPFTVAAATDRSSIRFDRTSPSWEETFSRRDDDTNEDLPPMKKTESIQRSNVSASERSEIDTYKLESSPSRRKISAHRKTTTKDKTVDEAQTPLSRSPIPSCVAVMPSDESHKDDSKGTNRDRASNKVSKKGTDKQRSRQKDTQNKGWLDGATLRWRIVVKHKKDYTDTLPRTSTASIEEIPDNEPTPPPAKDPKIGERRKNK